MPAASPFLPPARSEPPESDGCDDDAPLPDPSSELDGTTPEPCEPTVGETPLGVSTCGAVPPGACAAGCLSGLCDGTRPGLWTGAELGLCTGAEFGLLTVPLSGPPEGGDWLGGAVD